LRRWRMAVRPGESGGQCKLKPEENPVITATYDYGILPVLRYICR
jgi:hypothetical protein